MDVRQFSQAAELRLPRLDRAVLDVRLRDVIEDEGLEGKGLGESNGGLELFRVDEDIVGQAVRLGICKSNYKICCRNSKNKRKSYYCRF